MCLFLLGRLKDQQTKSTKFVKASKCLFLLVRLKDKQPKSTKFVNEILVMQPKRGVNWNSKNYSVYKKNSMQIWIKFKAITNKLTTIKRIREARFKHWDFYVVRPTLPTSTPPSFPSLRIPLSKPSRLQMLTLDFQGVNNLYNKRLSQSLNPSVSQHWQSLKNKRL